MARRHWTRYNSGAMGVKDVLALFGAMVAVYGWTRGGSLGATPASHPDV
jgi:hypothetical protein